MGWFGDSKKSEPSICDICISEAKRLQLVTVYVYPNGHMLRVGGGPPSLNEWPQRSKTKTFCGRDVNGMGSSVLYRMPTDAAPAQGARED